MSTEIQWSAIKYVVLHLHAVLINANLTHNQYVYLHLLFFFCGVLTSTIMRKSYLRELHLTFWYGKRSLPLQHISVITLPLTSYVYEILINVFQTWTTFVGYISCKYFCIKTLTRIIAFTVVKHHSKIWLS